MKKWLINSSKVMYLAKAVFIQNNLQYKVLCL